VARTAGRQALPSRIRTEERVVEQVLVYAGTVTFAVTGALVGIQKRFDVVGVLILAVVTAVGGGSIRDIVAGITPPTALTDELLLWLPFLVGLGVFLIDRMTSRRWATTRLLYGFDTVSLGLFAALGAERGLQIGFGLWGVVFAGAISGVGGGIIRDVLSGEIPGVMYRSGDFYASAAVAGALTTFALHGVAPTAAVIAGAVVAVAVRVGSRLAGLRLPVPRSDS
jgi:uncharacterized membrane protein YeiH